MQENADRGYTHVGDPNGGKTFNSKTVIDFPFDLNNLFSMQYSFD